MDNPWKQWEDASVLEEDQTGLEAYYEQVRKLYAVQSEGLVPFPFFGNPDEAVVWLLLANPGFKEKNFSEHANEGFRVAAKRSLQHEGLHPYLDETFQSYEGNKWWASIVGDVLKEFPGKPQQVLSKLMCVQIFPYHSKDFSEVALRKVARELYSWEYSRQLVLNAIERQRLIIIMRATWRDLLRQTLPKPLENYANILILDFKQVKQGRPYLNRRCLGDDNFERVVTSLRDTLAPERSGYIGTI